MLEECSDERSIHAMLPIIPIRNPKSHKKAVMAVQSRLQCDPCQGIERASALRNQDYASAGNVLDMRYLPEELSAYSTGMSRAQGILQEWRKQDRQLFPDYSAEEIEIFRGSLEFPSRNTSSVNQS